MNIAIIGAGAIGSVVAAYLTKEGVDVTLIGRQDQVDAVTKNGLTIKKSEGEENIRVNILPKLDKEYDLVIFATKTQDLGKAYQDNNEYLENCLVLTTQNGVQADNILSAHFEREKMYNSIVTFGATYIKPGKITYNFEKDWIIGKPFEAIDPKTHEIAKILGKAFPVEVTNNITGMKWTKLFINFNNCLPAIIGKSMQETYADIDFCRLSNMLLKEGVSIVKKAGVEMLSLPHFPVDRIHGLSGMPVDQAAAIIQKTLTTLSEEPLYGSILQSIKRGKVSEIDFINGEVVHMAAQIREKAPLNDKAVEMVHQVENTGKFFSADEVKKVFNL